MRRRDGEDGRSMELGGFYVLASTNRMGTKTLQEILDTATGSWGIRVRVMEARKLLATKDC